MSSNLTKYTYTILIILSLGTSYGFNGNVKFSDAFYAAQKFFYNEAKLKFPKIASDKFYPEIPIKGSATNDDLKKIEALTDFFEARRLFLKEVSVYPEQIYPEIFTFLSGHPGLTVNAGNKQKLLALEKYFYPFFYVFSQDKHYSFDTDIKTNPCPLIFCLKDEKKNTVSFSVYNTSKKNLEFNVSESPALAYLTVTSKRPLPVKAGSAGVVKFNVDVQKLKKDSSFKVLNIVLSDPTQPKVRLIIPVILLPNKDMLSLPPHFYDLNFSYSTFFKHISLQKEKSSWPERCPNGDCSGTKHYSLRNNERLFSTYNFGELCNIQYNVSSHSNPVYNIKNNSFKFTYNEMGNLEGADRNCPGAQAGSEVHCPTDAPNNGKELYGSRKLEFNVFLPPGKNHELRMTIQYNDLINQTYPNTEISWLQDKKLVVIVTDNSDKQILKEILNKSSASITQRNLSPGIYHVSIFPVTEDGKLAPSFNLQHLNNGNKAWFDFTLNGSFQLISTNPPSKK